MGKRIWKRPGSVAWKNALKKSAGRMAGNLLKAPGPRTKELAQENYLKNKTLGERKILRQLLVKARENKERQLDNRLEMHEEFRRKEGKICEAANALIREFNKNGSIEAAKRVRNSLEILLNENVQHISELELLEKKLPPVKAAEVKKDRQKKEHYCIEIIRNMKKVQDAINEES